MANILIVDDSSVTREMLRDFLEADGHSVVEASDGIEAIELLNAHKFELMITDLIMPRKDGMEVIMDIKKENRSIKIIAISGGDESFQASMYLGVTNKLGADLVFEKPFVSQEIVQAVKQLLA